MPAFRLYRKQNEQLVMEDREQPDPGIDQPSGKDDFLVGEETEDVDASGVDDHSTGMGEGDKDFLGKTNREQKE